MTANTAGILNYRASEVQNSMPYCHAPPLRSSKYLPYFQSIPLSSSKYLPYWQPPPLRSPKYGPVTSPPPPQQSQKRTRHPNPTPTSVPLSGTSCGAYAVAPLPLRMKTIDRQGRGVLHTPHKRARQGPDAPNKCPIDITPHPHSSP